MKNKTSISLTVIDLNLDSLNKLVKGLESITSKHANTFEIRVNDHKVTCRYCLAEFISDSIDARFCSTKCTREKYGI